MSKIYPDDSLVHDLRECLICVMQRGHPCLRVVASEMGMSERSLSRKLRMRGVHYQQIFAQLRFQLAMQLLIDRRWLLPEISLLLGFSEQSAFSRAFRSWSGQSPQRFRIAIFKESQARGCESCKDVCD